MTDEQEAELRRLGRLAVLSLAEQLIEDGDDLVEFAIDRAASLGVREYGDTSYHKDVEYLECDVAEELADAIFYQHLILLVQGAPPE